MSEMVERVAKALEGVIDKGNHADFLQSLARAAIEAMREPTPDMLDATYQVFKCFSGEFCEYNEYFEPDDVRELWPAMIDAALGKTPNAGDRTEGKPKP